MKVTTGIATVNPSKALLAYIMSSIGGGVVLERSSTWVAIERPNIARSTTNTRPMSFGRNGSRLYHDTEDRVAVMNMMMG